MLIAAIEKVKHTRDLWHYGILWIRGYDWQLTWTDMSAFCRLNLKNLDAYDVNEVLIRSRNISCNICAVPQRRTSFDTLPTFVHLARV